MNDCVFCKIIGGEIPSTKVYTDDFVTCFRDINPAAPTHILIIPNRHIASVNEITEADEQVMGHMFTAAKEVAIQEGIKDSGYRLIVNTGPNGRQEVFHVHMHLLGGHKMRHPMG
jgi:histidine triad (HIT) family protein